MKLAHFLPLAAVLFSSQVTLGEQKSPIAAARFGISIDGVQVTALNVTGGGSATDKLTADQTPLKITIDRDDSDAMWSWITASVNQGIVEKKIEAQAKQRRRATFTNAQITEVKFDDLDANNSKKQMTVTITVVPQKIVGATDVAAPKAKAVQKRWSPSNFRAKIGGLPLAKTTKIEALAIKQKVTESGKPPVFVAENVVLHLDVEDRKKLADTLAKDKTKPFVIELTNDDGSVWKTITFTGVNAKPTKGASGSMTMKGSKILIN